MAALDFPSSPTVGQVFTSGGTYWVWDGTSWNSNASLTLLSSGGMQQIGKVVTSGSQATVDFSNIPQNYTNLIIAYQCRDTAAGNGSQALRVRLNNDSTAANYTSASRIAAQNAAAVVTTVAASTGGVMIGGIPVDGNTVGISGSGRINFNNYAGTTFHKTYTSVVEWDDAATNLSVGDFMARWVSTAAINRITITTDGTAFKDGSVFLLLGEGPTNFSVSPFVDPALCNGRLSLTSGVPITTADVTGAATIYWTPFRGNRMSLYSNGAWSTLSSAEVSLALGTLTSAKNYDVFAYNNSGVLTLEFLVWTSDTARATALVMQDGVYVKSGDATRRYLGTFYTTSTTTTEDSLLNRNLWNYYNRANRLLTFADSTSHSYGTGTFRYWNNSSASRIAYVIGVVEDSILATLEGEFGNTGISGMTSIMAIGLDNGTANVSKFLRFSMATTSVLNTLGATVSYGYIPAVGRHFLSAVEYSSTTNTTYTECYLQATLSG